MCMSKNESLHSQYNNVFVFDGICNFCNWIVLFVIKRDTDFVFRFVSMQSATGQKLLRRNGISTNDVKTFLLIQNGQSFTGSDAALNISTKLNGLWKYLRVFRFLPRKFRDTFYYILSDNRYKWFGKKDRCMVPSPDIKMRFLE